MPINVGEELVRLKRLRDEGVLSDAEFDEQKRRILAGDAKPAKAGGIVGKGCAVMLAIFVILLIVGMIVSPAKNDSAGTAATSTKLPPPIAVTAAELARAYEANEAAAQKSYGDRPLLVSARVASVQLGVGDEPFLVLEGTNPFMGPQAKLDEASQAKASGLSKGDAVELRCKDVSEIIGTPMLSGCVLQ